MAALNISIHPQDIEYFTRQFRQNGFDCKYESDFRFVVSKEHFRATIYTWSRTDFWVTCSGNSVVGVSHMQAVQTIILAYGLLQQKA